MRLGTIPCPQVGCAFRAELTQDDVDPEMYTTLCDNPVRVHEGAFDQRYFDEIADQVQP